MYDGTYRVERGWIGGGQVNGTCYNSGFSTTCYCTGSHCNKDLCQQCFTTTEHPIITNQSYIPTSTTHHTSIKAKHTSHTTTQPPSTTNQPPTPRVALRCFSCINCDTVNDDTIVKASEEFLTCFIAIQIGNAQLVI